jgi:hypothetical protein
MKNAVFWDMASCRYCVNRRFGGTLVHTISTLVHIPEDGILHSHQRENLKSYTGRNMIIESNRRRLSLFLDWRYPSSSGSTLMM